jgi:hypothetical protein
MVSLGDKYLLIILIAFLSPSILPLPSLKYCTFFVCAYSLNESRNASARRIDQKGSGFWAALARKSFCIFVEFFEVFEVSRY